MSGGNIHTLDALIVAFMVEGNNDGGKQGDQGWARNLERQSRDNKDIYT